MSAGSHARARIARQSLTPSTIERALSRILPRRNCYGTIDYEELLGELREFGISTNSQFRKLMLRHRKALIAADREPLTPIDERMYRKEWGDSVVADKLRRQYWWSWAGMVRFALQFQFKGAYSEFADRRDRV